MTKLVMLLPILKFEELERRTAQECESIAREDVQVQVVSLEEGPASIECEYDVVTAEPGILRAVKDAEKSGADACMISCFGDPGIDAAREVAGIPIIGAAETSMHLASMLGQRFSIITVLPQVKPRMWNRAHIYGLACKIASIRDIQMPVLELDKNWNKIEQRLFEESKTAIERDGAQVITLGCTGMVGMAASLQRDLWEASYRVPVIDPVHAMIKYAEGLIDMKLSYSRITYPLPPAKKR